MRVDLYDDLIEFDAAVRPFLLRYEAENNVMLGMLRRRLDAALRGVQLDTEPPLLCVVTDGGEIAGAAAQTPPYGINLTRMGPGALDALANALSRRSIRLFGTHGLREVSERFASDWSERQGVAITRRKPLYFYKLNALLPIELPSGGAQLATLDDLDLLWAWEQAFGEELGMPVTCSLEDVRERITSSADFVWRTSVPVATAGFRRTSDTAARIVGVYVPREHRRRGYASAVVRATTEHVLQLGLSNVFLFTDAEDVAPNAAYTRLGYERLAEFADYRFGDTQ